MIFDGSQRYSTKNLTGIWKGAATNPHCRVPLSLRITADGHVSGSGISAQWQINGLGKVSGGGSFTFCLQENCLVVPANWSLQFDSQVETLTGCWKIQHESFGEMTVALKRTSFGNKNQEKKP